MVDSRYFHRKEFLMVEAAEEEVRQTEPGLVGWGRWNSAVEWSVSIDFQPGEGRP